MCTVVWYFVVIGIAVAVAIKFLIPYIKRRYIETDDTKTCPICNSRYGRNIGSCPRCGAGGR